MSKILVILTGGTIGSSVENNLISVASDSKKYKIIELYKEKNPYLSKDIIFETCEPYTILSENLPFSDAVGIDGKDMRIETTTEGNNIRATKTIGDNLRKDISIGVPAQKQNYFFLPAIVYNNTTLTAAPANGNWIYYGCSSQALYIHYQPTYGYNSYLGTWCIMFKRSDNSAQLWTYVGYNQPLPAGPIVASWFK